MINYWNFETPCFILNEEELQRSINGFKSMLNSYVAGNSIIGYSVKTNSLPHAMKVARDLGCYAEVVSADEYELALLCGFNQERIIYNGPLKSKETFLQAIKDHAIVNIETKRELDWLQELPSHQTFHVGIRLNINISKVSPQDAANENDNSRFGFDESNGEFIRAIKRIQSYKNIHLSGLHIHRTSHTRSVEFYQRTIEYASTVIKKYGLNLNYIDIGGGYYGIFRDKPTYQDYSQVIAQTLTKNDLEKLDVIVEPGNALVASSFEFLSEVVDTKDVESISFVATDGSRNDIDPFFRKNSYIYTLLFHDKDRLKKSKQVIGGCTCLENDRLFQVDQEKELKVGDRILYHNVGAYTMCLSPLFIRFFPNVYAVRGDNIYIVRNRWQAKDYINKNL